MIIASFPEDERQALALALAKLSIERPGWLHYLRAVAARLQAVDLFDRFRETHTAPTEDR